MKKICALILGLVIAVASAHPATAQQTQSAPPVRLPGAVAYDFPGQWVLLGDALGENDNILVFYYDRARTRRAGSIVATVWVGIDEKNIDTIRTNLYETEFDCATNRARFVRTQNYDAAHYPLATPPESNKDWVAVASGSVMSDIARTLCGADTGTPTTSSKVQTAALEVIRARRAKLAANASLNPGFIVGRWTDRANCSTATAFYADGRFEGAVAGSGTWALVRDELRLTYRDRPTLSSRLLVIDRDTMEVTQTDGSTARTVRCQSQSSNATGQAANPLEPTSIADAQQRFSAALDGGLYTIGEGNPPGQWRALDSSTACLNRFRLLLPARTGNGRTWPASSTDYDVPWSQILSVDTVPGSPYVRLATAANPTFGFEVRLDKQPAAVAAARYLAAHCAPGSGAPAQGAASMSQPQSEEFADKWGPYATLARHGWWRRNDGAYWHYSWITPGQELRVEFFSADGQRAWNLKYRIESGVLLTSDQIPPRPIRLLTARSIEHGQYDRITLSEDGRSMTYRSGDQDSTYVAAQAPSFARSQTPQIGAGPAASPSRQTGVASEGPLLLHWSDGGRWRPNRVWDKWDAYGVSTTLRTVSGPLRHQITFVVQICNTGAQIWRGGAAFYETRELSPTTFALQPGECGELQRTQLNGEYQVYVSLTKLN